MSCCGDNSVLFQTLFAVPLYIVILNKKISLAAWGFPGCSIYFRKRMELPITAMRLKEMKRRIDLSVKINANKELEVIIMNEKN